MNIRAVTESDVERVIDLWREIFPEYRDPDRPQRDPRANIVRKLAFGDGLFWLAEEGGEIVATVMAGYDGHRGWIYSLGVAAAWRRHGIATAMMEHVEAELHALGCPKINLQMLDTNQLAREFYAAAGYRADAVVAFGKRLV